MTGLWSLTATGRPLPVQRTAGEKRALFTEKAEPGSEPAAPMKTPPMSSATEPASATRLPVGDQPPSDPGGGEGHDL